MHNSKRLVDFVKASLVIAVGEVESALEELLLGEGHAEDLRVILGLRMLAYCQALEVEGNSPIW